MSKITGCTTAVPLLMLALTLQLFSGPSQAATTTQPKGTVLTFGSDSSSGNPFNEPETNTYPYGLDLYNKYAIWSEQVKSTDKSSSTYKLKIWDGETVSDVPVDPRSVAFDVDLGPGPGGSLNAVYSRCKSESDNKQKGCDLYRYDFSKKREIALTSVNSPNASEYLPSIWGDEIAFGRQYDSGNGYSYLNRGSVTHSGRTQRVGEVQRKKCSTNKNTGRTYCTDPTHAGPREVELAKGNLAFTWSYDAFSEGQDTALFLQLKQGTLRRIDHVGGGGITGHGLLGLSFENDFLYYGQSCYGDPGGCTGDSGNYFKRFKFSNSTLQSAHAPGQLDSFTARDGSYTYYLKSTETSSSGEPDIHYLIKTQPSYTS